VPPEIPQANAEPAPWRDRRDRLRRRLPSLAAFTVVFAAVAIALADGLSRFPPLSDDEGTYVAQSWAARTTGQLAHYTYWYDHPPLGWLQLAGLDALSAPVRLLLGDASTAVLEARQAMLVPALVSVALVYVLARRCGLSWPFAALAMAAFGLSPLSVAMLRQVLLDGLALPWVLAAFVLAASPHRRLWSFAAAGTCAAIGVLSKETMLIVVPALVLAVWSQSDRRTRPFCMTAFTVPFVLIVAGYPLYAILKGELIPGAGHVSLADAIWFQIVSRASTGSPLDPSSASHTVVQGWLSIDALLVVAGVVAVPLAISRRRLRPIALALAIIVVVALRPGYLPQPYVLVALPFAALVATAAVERLWRWVDVRARRRRHRAPLRVLFAATALVPIVAVGVHWHQERGDRDAYDANRAYAQATRWIERNVARDRRVLVDDTFFVDLADAGFRPGLGVVWFSKLDTATNLDPSVIRALPRGADEFDVVVSTPIMRSTLEQNPGTLGEVRRAIRRGRVTRSFGSTSDERVEILRLPRTTTTTDTDTEG
jgi:hypothetical protein